MKCQDKITVFYDGACPICAREIAFYRRRYGKKMIDWEDISLLKDCDSKIGISKSMLLKRLHIRKRNGMIVTGGAAFAYLWSSLTNFRFLRYILRLKLVIWSLEKLYDLFLSIRPYLQGVEKKLRREC